MAQLLLLYENAGGSEAEYWIDYDYRRLRPMVEISSFDSGEVERELNDIAANAARLFPEASVTTVGSIPQFTVMMQYVARGQMVSFCHLSPYYRHPNDVGLWQCTHRAYRFDTQYHSGFGGRRTDGMAGLPVGYDDRNHYADDPRFGCRRHHSLHQPRAFEFDRRGNYRDAILRSFRTIGTPIILTSVVICANFAIYMTSGNLFIHMGLLSVAGIVSALVVLTSALHPCYSKSSGYSGKR